jgi:hypothetical protein
VSNRIKLNGLFISFDGIGSSIFDSQVSAHAKAMRELGVNLDIVAFEPFRKAWGVSRNNLYNNIKSSPEISITLIKASNIYLPLANIVNFFIVLFSIKKATKSNQYDFIHARSDYSAYICYLTQRFHKLPIIWDCRGDSVDELKDALSRKTNIFTRLYGKYLMFVQRKIVKHLRYKMKFGVFVSDELFKTHFSGASHIVSKIIPCPVNDKYFYFDEKVRDRARRDLGYYESDNVFLYSGSMIAYQGIKKQVEVYRKVISSDSNARILIVTPDTQLAEELFLSLDQSKITILSSTFDKMNYYYNAADFAFLLREKKQLNHVASPTKFGEYCLCGLPVIMNDTVEQAYKYSKLIGNYCSVNETGYNKISYDARNAISIHALRYYSRSAVDNRYIDLYLKMEGE